MFCKKCGTEMQESWKICPKCGNPREVQTETSTQKPDKAKVHKPIYKRVWFWVLLVIALLMIIVNISGGKDDPKEAKKSTAVEKESAEVKSLEDAGGFGQWKEDGFPGMVHTDIIIALPVTPREVNNYAVGIGALAPATIIIMQEDESVVKDWEWLMDAQPFEEGGDRAYFKATLKYVGQTPDEDDLPVFVANDIESY